MYEEPMPDQWLSLSEASTLLGVHASTLRRWADSGRVPCQRTPGGHRRFNRRKLLQMIEGTSVAGATDVDPGKAGDQKWHTIFESAGLIGDLREMGQRLSGVLVQFLLRDDEDERLLEEAAAIGEAVAQASKKAGINQMDALNAYLFFRAGHIDLLSQLPASEPSTATRAYARYDYFMSQVLLGFMSAYHES
jgi:excisionase family DNA binding protein